MFARAVLPERGDVGARGCVVVGCDPFELRSGVRECRVELDRHSRANDWCAADCPFEETRRMLAGAAARLASAVSRMKLDE